MVNSTGLAHQRPQWNLKAVVGVFLLAIVSVIYLLASSTLPSKEGGTVHLKATASIAAASAAAHEVRTMVEVRKSMAVATTASSAATTPHSIFDFSMEAIDGGADVPLANYKGAKAFLVVNLASQ
jgi:hypothetical protein